MPNWCSNTLKVTSEHPESLKLFLKLALNENGEFHLSGLHPTPEELLSETSPQVYRGENDDEQAKKDYDNKVTMLKNKYGHTCWYQWRLNQWGTKWDVSEVIILDNDEDCFEVNFETAWAPPSAWLRYVADKYPALNFTLWYLEPGMGFCGKLEISDGVENLQESDCTYEDDDENLVTYDESKSKWIDYKGVEIDDEDFYPNPKNPFE